MSTTGKPPELRDLVEVPRFLGDRPRRVHRVEGTTPSGRAVVCELSEGRTLLLFLSTTCDGCAELWGAFADASGSAIPEGMDAVFVTRGPGTESRAAVAGRCGGAMAVMSDDAWSDYEVHSGPFFVVVDGGAGRVVTEGVAWSVSQVLGAIAAAGSGL